MKKSTKGDMRPEYDFSTMKDGVRGKYTERYAEGTNLVLLEDDVAEVFRDAKAVNDALRSLIRIAAAKTRRAA